MNIGAILKHPFVLIASSFLGLFLFYRFGPAASLSIVTTPKPEPFAVSGQGSVSAVPDEAIINLGIEKSGSNLRTTQEEVNKTLNSLSEGLRELGVKKEDIKTTNYSIFPEYDYFQSGSARITGYRVSTNLEVKIREIDKASDVLERSTAFGANSVGGVQFAVNEERQKELLQEARKKAISQAKEKAQSLAHLAGITLGRVISVSESQEAFPIPLYERALAPIGGGVEPIEKPQIEPGQTEIKTTVTLYYETR